MTLRLIDTNYSMYTFLCNSSLIENEIVLIFLFYDLVAWFLCAIFVKYLLGGILKISEMSNFVETPIGIPTLTL